MLYSVVNGLNKTLFLGVGMRNSSRRCVIGAFSVAGIPPAVGFIGKLEMFRTAIAASNPTHGPVFVEAPVLIYLFQVYQRLLA